MKASEKDMRDWVTEQIRAINPHQVNGNTDNHLAFIYAYGLLMSHLSERMQNDSDEYFAFKAKVERIKKSRGRS